MDFIRWISGSKCQTTLKEEKQSRWTIWVPWHIDRREFLSCNEGSGKLAGPSKSLQIEDTELGGSIYHYNWYSQYIVLKKKRQQRYWEYWKSSEGPLMMNSNIDKQIHTMKLSNPLEEVFCHRIHRICF